MTPTVREKNAAPTVDSYHHESVTTEIKSPRTGRAKSPEALQIVDLSELSPNIFLSQDSWIDVIRPKRCPAMVPPPPTLKQTSVVPSQAEWEWEMATQRVIMGRSKAMPSKPLENMQNLFMTLALDGIGGL